MIEKTFGIVVLVKKQWWLKINTKAFRKGTFDGAIFPHVIKVKYEVGEKTFFKRKWISANVNAPSVNEKVLVYYQNDKPRKAKIELLKF